MLAVRLLYTNRPNFSNSAADPTPGLSTSFDIRCPISTAPSRTAEHVVYPAIFWLFPHFSPIRSTVSPSRRLRLPGPAVVKHRQASHPTTPHGRFRPEEAPAGRWVAPWAQDPATGRPESGWPWPWPCR